MNPLIESVSRVKLVCSAGVSPVRVRARSPVAWTAEGRETDPLKPVDKVIGRDGSESPGRSESERIGGLENRKLRRSSPLSKGEGGMDSRKLAETAVSLRRGVSDGMVTRARQATGEALLAPGRNPWRKVGPITGRKGKWTEGQRVAEGPEVVMNRGNARGAKGPCC